MVFCIIHLLSCDDRAAGLREFNDLPSITLQAQRGGEKQKRLFDSVKISNPDFAYVPFLIEISDPNQNIKHVRYEVISGAGQLEFRGERLSGDTVAVVDNQAIYRFYPGAAGNTSVRFIVTDYFNLQDSATLELFVFSNLPPVAALNTTYLGQADKYEYSLDARGSYDADQSFGGGINKYTFSVGATKIAETSYSVIHYIFPGPGSYTVRLSAMDAEGASSKEVSQIIIIN